MNLAQLIERLHAEHYSSPQACLTISAAVAEVEHGLALLARIGHVFHLEPGAPYPLPRWPRVLFHVEAAPNGRVVNSWWEADELGPGWWPTLTEAQQREGIRAQFAGRGGVRGRSLPMLVDGGPAGPRPVGAIPVKDNNRVIEEWKRSIEGVRSTGGGVWGNVTIHDGGAETTNRTGSDGITTAAATSEDVSGEPGMGHQGPGDNGPEDRLRDDRPTSASGIPEDVIQGEHLQDREQLDGGAGDELRRVLASSGRTISEVRAARGGTGSTNI